jgi:hypothetical protein
VSTWIPSSSRRRSELAGTRSGPATLLFRPRPKETSTRPPSLSTGAEGLRGAARGHRRRADGPPTRRDAGQVTRGGRRVRRADVRKDAAKLPHPVTTVGQQPRPQTGRACAGLAVPVAAHCARCGRSRSPAGAPAGRAQTRGGSVRISSGSLSDPGRGVRSRGERRSDGRRTGRRRPCR